MPDHDTLYKRLFKHRILAWHLIRGFLPIAMAAGVDFQAMSLFPTKGHPDRTGRARERDGDIIWRLPTSLGAEIVLYILFEFQSTVDRWMALRVMVYQGLALQQLIAEKQIEPKQPLPPVLAVVLYNGQDRRLLKRKFGDVPPEWETRVRRGTVAELMTWTDRVLDAQSLEAVFLDS